MSTEAKPVAIEAGHWYTKSGKPMYAIIGKNGKERATTLRDARELGLVPSVTTITKLLAAPGLIHYFRRQMWEATCTTARLDGETDKDYYARCEKWAEEHAELARNNGTAVHAAIEQELRGEEHGWNDHVAAVGAALADKGITLLDAVAEKSFAHPLGFGGKVDAYSSAGNWLVDFKTKDAIGDEQLDGKGLAYLEHEMQLAAYAYGLGLKNPRCLNVFVGVTDKRVVVVPHDAPVLVNALEIFVRLLEIWQIKTQYNSSFDTE